MLWSVLVAFVAIQVSGSTKWSVLDGVDPVTKQSSSRVELVKAPLAFFFECWNGQPDKTLFAVTNGMPYYKEIEK